MAKKANIGPAITLDGEAAFRESIKVITKDMAVLSSEMKLATAAFSTNADSVEALTAKSVVYNKQIDAQKLKIETLSSALAKATTEYGTADSRTKDWTIQLNNAEAKLSELNNELKSNETNIATMQTGLDKSGEKIEATTKKTTSFNGVLGELSHITGVQLPFDMDKFAVSTDDMAVSVGGAVTTVIGLVVALQKNMVDAAKDVRELQMAAQMASVTDQQMQALQYAEKITGVTTDKMIEAYSKTTEFVKRLIDGNVEAVAIQEKLGISIYDTNGNLKASDDLFNEIVVKLSDIGDGTARNITAMGIFGENAKSLYQIFDDGGEKMKGAIKEAWDTGIVKTDEYNSKLIASLEQISIFFAQINSFMGDLAIWWTDFTDQSFTFSETLLSLFGPGGSAAGKIINDVTGEQTPWFSWDAIWADLEKAFSYGDSISEEIVKTTGDTADSVKTEGEKQWESYQRIISMTEEGTKSTDKTTEAIITGTSATVDAIAKKNAEEIAAAEKRAAWEIHFAEDLKSGRGVIVDTYANGTDYVPKTGLYQLHEGEAVKTAAENRSSGDVIYVTISAKDVQEFNDIVRIAKGAKQSYRMGVV